MAIGKVTGEGSRTLAFLLVYILAWVVSHAISDTNLDPYGDMLENYAWGQQFLLGSTKHPPLIGWIAGTWFRIWPEHDVAYHLLAYCNAAFGLLAVFVLARALGPGRLALPAMLCLSLALPFSTLAIKFNANSVLLWLWPWTIYAWVKATQKNDRRYLYAVLFGLLAALSMLGKYYSGILLASLALATLISPLGRRWLTTPAPWIAFGIFCLCLAPHIKWVVEQDFVTLHYAAGQGDGEIDFPALLRFMLAPALYWLIPWLLVTWLTMPIGSSWLAVPRRMMLCWRWRGADDLLFWLAVLPFLLTLLAGLTGLVSLSLPWAIPLGSLFPLLWLRNLLEHEVTAPRFGKFAYLWLVLVVGLSPIYAWHQSRSGEANYYLPREMAAEAILDDWHKQFGDVPVRWVSGYWAESALLAFYGNPRIDVLETLPKVEEGTEAGVIICPIGYVDKPRPTSCSADARQWLANRYPGVVPKEIVLARSGFRYLQSRPYQYEVFFVPPEEVPDRVRR